MSWREKLRRGAVFKRSTFNFTAGEPGGGEGGIYVLIKVNGQLTRTCIKCLDAGKALRERNRCPHGWRGSACKECGGRDICRHEKVRAFAIWPHERQRSRCKECGGSQICHHQRVRSTCKEFKGGQICKHKRQRTRCKDCGVSQICHHQKRRWQCPICDPDGDIAAVVRCRTHKALKGNKELISQEYLRYRYPAGPY
ncbi:uncharacterized protein LOC130612161 [Hydractinia symbiolongicarpus]|uniref:uncharacterized protein LOC130612161 n=1 Tax=Hydractinia symbiolongicarpus TaxID=13093 RepID=UPI00255051A8|nr:uncharacterized protein LOC130612161 [Hydractinia symbiolongicarpus]